MITLDASKRFIELYIDNRDNKNLNGYYAKTEANEVLIANDTLFIFYSHFKSQYLVHKEEFKGKELNIAFWGAHIHKNLREAEDKFKKFTLAVGIPSITILLPTVFYMMYKILGH